MLGEQQKCLTLAARHFGEPGQLQTLVLIHYITTHRTDAKVNKKF